jgi:diguanylate cyclase (GGDEF)-like protein
MNYIKILLVEDDINNIDEMQTIVKDMLKNNIKKKEIQLKCVRPAEYPNETGYDLILFGYKSLEIMHGLSLFDDLTGLYNRRGFFYFLEQYIKEANRAEKSFFLFYMDLNDFSKINNHYGHIKGDKVLVEFSEILRNTFRDCDIIARVGGDEYTVFPASCDDHQDSIKDRLFSNIAKYNENSEVKISVSIGIAYYDYNAPCSPDELIHNADTEMYKHKNTIKQGMA